MLGWSPILVKIDLVALLEKEFSLRSMYCKPACLEMRSTSRLTFPNISSFVSEFEENHNLLPHRLSSIIESTLELRRAERTCSPIIYSFSLSELRCSELKWLIIKDWILGLCSMIYLKRLTIDTLPSLVK